MGFPIGFPFGKPILLKGVIFLKKIIALIAVLAIIISILNISAFATSEPSSMTNQEYYSAQFDLIDKFCDGDITYIQFQEQSQAVTDEYITANTVGGVLQSGALNASNNIAALSLKIGATVDKWGDNAREHVSDWWNDICNKNNVPTDTVQNPTTNLGGYGAAFRYGNDCYVCDYVIVDNSNPTGPYKIQIGKFNNDDLPVTRYYLQGGKWVRDLNGYGNSYLSGFRIVDGQIISSDNKFVELYGDVRYINGEQYPTDDEWEYGTLKKFDDMPEKDLEDLLNDFAEEIERQNPDLSSIEGLLNAIYARLGTLDSDNDNDLLASINANILALLKADKDKDEKEDNTNEELINTLLEIRDSLKEGTFGTAPEAHGHEISGTVYNVLPLDKNFLNKLFHVAENLKVEYEGKVYYLEDCGCLKLGEKYYTPNMNYDSYAFADYDFSNNNINIDTDKYVNFDFTNYNNVSVKLTASQRKKIDNIVDLIYKMVSQAVPYAAITTAFAPFEVIIFNTAVPEDIVLNFDGTGEVGSFDAIILSVSFFQNQYVAAAMGIVKPFLTVVIGYCWLKVMRRKAVSMLG